MITSEEIRKLFLEFFEKKGHKIVSSSSLIPYDDNSVLLTTAGMQQFKKYFLREKDSLEDFGSQRATSIQKCFRTTDIEEIGDERHLTFFEMLGNFSFGPVGIDDPKDFGTSGYFKKSAIYWAYEFINNLGLKIDYVTVFGGEGIVPFDEESYQIWYDIGFSKEKIFLKGKEDNFWGPTGNEGPCGPTTEIYIDNIEVWNLVFNEYYQNQDKSLTKLQFPGVDTGMGLERLMKVIQKVDTVFETDLFLPLRDILFNEINKIDIRRTRIILDHLRSSVFLVADGLYPSNLERGYILRRILRRLTLSLKLVGFNLNNIDKLIQGVISKYSYFYEELKKFDKIKEVIISEMKNFEKTLNRALKEFYKLVKGNESDSFLAEKVFLLYTSYGLPLEIAKELLKEININWSIESQLKFDDLFKNHQQISKKIKK